MAQDMQKTWYDKSARDRSFIVGEKVMVLLPSASNKLQAKWQGPAQSTKKLSDVNYEVAFGKRKPQRGFHINMLRKWHERKSLSTFLSGYGILANSLG